MNSQMNNLINILRAAVTDEILPLNSPDWDELYRLAKLHLVVPLFNEGAEKYPEYDDMADELRFNVMVNSAAMISLQVQQSEFFLKTYDSLLAAGLRPLVLKGLICRLTYGELADHRASGDNDIYIHKSDFEKCRQTLQNLGYEMKNMDVSADKLRLRQAIDFTLPPHKIEVHVNLFHPNSDIYRECNSYFEKAFSTAAPVNVGDHTVYTMDPTRHFLYLVMHFYKHLTASGVGIRQILDMMMFYRAHRESIDLTQVESLLPKLNAAKLYPDILAIGELLGVSVPTKLSPTDPGALLDEITDAGIFGTDDKERSRGNIIVREAAYKTKAVSLLRRIFPTLSDMTENYPKTDNRLWRYPAMWLYRFSRFFVRKNVILRSRKILVQNVSHKFAGNHSLELADKRLRLLKEYGIIE